MPTRATQPIIDNIVNKINSGQYLAAKKLIMGLPKQEAVIATAFAVEAVGSPNHRVSEFLDALLGGS
jgi:hypothetical protein